MSDSTLEEAVPSSNFILTYLFEVSNGKESGFVVNVTLDNGKDLGLVNICQGIFLVGGVKRKQFTWRFIR